MFPHCSFCGIEKNIDGPSTVCYAKRVFSPSHPAKILLQWCFTKRLNRALIHTGGSVQDTEGQASPLDAAASATPAPQLRLARSGKPGGVSVGISVLARLRAEPQRPSLATSVAREISCPKPWAFMAAVMASGWDCKPGPSHCRNVQRTITQEDCSRPPFSHPYLHYMLNILASAEVPLTSHL